MWSGSTKLMKIGENSNLLLARPKGGQGAKPRQNRRRRGRKINSLSHPIAFPSQMRFEWRTAYLLFFLSGLTA